MNGCYSDSYKAQEKFLAAARDVGAVTNSSRLELAAPTAAS